MIDESVLVHTPRLVVRRLQPAMAAAMARFYAENWEGHLDRWSPPAGPAWATEAFWTARIERAEGDWHAGIAARFVIQPHGPAEGPVIGTCNYTNIIRGAFQACHLGYQVAHAHEGLGYMSEALAPLNAWVFRTFHLHRIMANHLPENERSARLLGRLGFEREGLARDYLYIGGAWRDHVLNALVNPDFDTSRIEIT
jgi:ribosomal-protein-alanine N-acetyltransferase